MFLEAPSTRTMLDGFMVKEGRDFSDFQSLVGFNLEQIDFYLFQASTLIFVENCLKDFKFPIEVCNMTIHDHKMYIKIMDNNMAKLYIEFANNHTVILQYNYRTDNFPVINYLYQFFGSVKRANSQSIGMVPEFDKMLNMGIVSDIGTYIPHLLWRAYKSKSERNENAR